MSMYFNVEGREVEVKTPMLANLLPFIGLALGSGISYYKTKSVQKSILWGLGIGVLCLLPKLLFTKKALDEVKDENDRIRRNVKKDVHEGIINEKEPVTSEKIYELIERLAEKNGNIDVLTPKKDYFFSVLDSFSQDQKNAALDYMIILNSVPKNATEDEIGDLLQRVADLETIYGKDVYDVINARFNELGEEINAPKNDNQKSVAA